MRPTKSHRQIVVSVTDIITGTHAAPHCDAAIPTTCSLCGAKAVLPLDSKTRNAQPDATSHVCHPCIGGCNHGFTVYQEAK
jgi:hypothetical protein